MVSRATSAQVRVVSERFAPWMVTHDPDTMPGRKLAPSTTAVITGPVAAPAGGSRYIRMPLFAGVDQTVSPPQPQIYFYDPLGAQFHAVGYAASGSGSGTIRSILSFQDRYGQPRPTEMNLQQAVQFALRLLMIASEFDSATGGVNPQADTFATIKVLRGSGVEAILAGRQAELLKS